MSWTVLLTCSLVGLAASMVAVVVTVMKGIEYRRWLPKREVSESLDALKLQREEARDEYDEVREQIFEAKQDIQRAEEQREWMDQTRDEVADLRNLKAEVEDVDRRLAAHTTELLEKQEQLSDVSSELAKQQRELLPLEERQAAKKEHAALLDETAKLKKEAADYGFELDTLERQRISLLGEVKDANHLIGELTARQADLVKVRDELSLETTKLREESAQLETRCLAQLEQLEELKSAKVEFGGAPAETSTEASTQLLWEPAVQISDYSQSRPRGESEEQALEVAMGRIQEAGFIYDPRVIRAFHTSLKCSEEAPLLVLAGLSGTGKSALPTRYSEAMGIHQLSVAVQPGWDSPADLLGFYNHLEGRFRPTDLTRALLQMDYVRRSGEDTGDSGAWPETSTQRVDASDRMLLVLLDEMNLARVEYYFSEFLSVLEQRRGVKASDRVARSRAEIRLDLGYAGEGGNQSLAVFPGENVLFVGTMNEDESTQTLSDKVIDRSNVMRFGRPNQLVTREAKPISGRSSDAFLSRATWSKWVNRGQELGDQDSRQVNEWIGKVNHSLSELGRPFAHRVARAMRLYVRHYPVKGDKGIQDAFADQVEFRVLPRLRGLDVHEGGTRQAFDGIRRLLSEDLGDEALADAFTQAQQPSRDQLFHWGGIDRVAGPDGAAR